MTEKIADLIEDLKKQLLAAARLDHIHSVTHAAGKVVTAGDRAFTVELLFDSGGMEQAKHEVLLFRWAEIILFSDGFRKGIESVLKSKNLSGEEIEEEYKKILQSLEDYWPSAWGALLEEAVSLWEFRRCYEEENERDLWPEERKRNYDPLKKYLDIEEELLKKGYSPEEIEKLKQTIDEEIKQSLLAPALRDIEELRKRRQVDLNEEKTRRAQQKNKQK